MNTEFRQAIAVLQQVNEDFSKGHTSAVAHGHTRAAAISAALTYMAKSFGVQLQSPGLIDGNGEFNLVALDGDRDPRLGCGRFGEKYVGWLNTAKPRTGVLPSTLCADNGWCRMNHFEAERMVLAYFEANA